MKAAILIICLIVVAALAWVRLAPSDPDRWHRAAAPKDLGDYPEAGAFEAVRRIAQPDAPARLHEVILATPRTQVLAGTPEEGLVTYVTRSRIAGFPDYTSVAIRGDVVSIHGRLRFGASDLGVNKARILGWLDRVEGFSGP